MTEGEMRLRTQDGKRGGGQQEEGPTQGPQQEQQGVPWVQQE